MVHLSFDNLPEVFLIPPAVILFSKGKDMWERCNCFNFFICFCLMSSVFIFLSQLEHLNLSCFCCMSSVLLLFLPQQVLLFRPRVKTTNSLSNWSASGELCRPLSGMIMVEMGGLGPLASPHHLQMQIRLKQVEYYLIWPNASLSIKDCRSFYSLLFYQNTITLYLWRCKVTHESQWKVFINENSIKEHYYLQKVSCSNKIIIQRNI